MVPAAGAAQAPAPAQDLLPHVQEQLNRQAEEIDHDRALRQRRAAQLCYMLYYTHAMRVEHWNKLCIRIGFHTATITCNLFHLVNVTITWLFTSHHYNRAIYGKKHLDCEFDGDRNMQQMPDNVHKSQYVTRLAIISSCLTMFSVCIVSARQRTDICGTLGVGALFLFEVAINLIFQVMYCVLSVGSIEPGDGASVPHDPDVGFFRAVSVVSVVSTVVCVCGLWSLTRTRGLIPSPIPHAVRQGAPACWGSKMWIQGLSSHMNDLLNNCLTKLHVRVTLLFGYFSMVIWVALIQARHYCSNVNTMPFYCMITAFATILAFGFFKSENRRSRKQEYTDFLNAWLKGTYLVFAAATYFWLGDFAHSDSANYTPGSNATVRRYKSQYARAVNATPVVTRQFDAMCATSCDNFVQLTKSGWLTALFIVNVVHFGICMLVDFHDKTASQQPPNPSDTFGDSRLVWLINKFRECFCQ